MKEARCHICLGDIREGLDLISCPCGRDFHETCASKFDDCPSCGRALQNI